MAVDQDRAAGAVEFLINSAAEYGASKADAIRAETMLRVVKALVMKSTDEKAIAAQEREAYASEAYLQAVDDLFEATRACETLRAKRDAAQATIEFWRSRNANERAAERGFASAR